ncbi:sugar phosphate isomerase/epimerase family protein [Pelagovum pacificum]|uniref:Sugar phosphate isomerase/epimerase n=1 Tax=Pelagovum pacificum TaxID=2588711 RepID=A0A5C5GHD2_9RHOB|nr:sugar phosphate isomerase/epimerase [Pelagovum pacificum]QQA42664.1 sugar phosphate isomerase/epimerase [Pelagovum pacificum]TNY34185.1 sugar phosphate isomerase/epimerase [Pelagovum pacificum]
MTTISYQLYCSRNFPPLEDTLSMLAGLGFKEVEGWGGQYDDPVRLRELCDAAGVTMTTGHMGLAMLEDTPEKAVTTAKTMGMKAVMVPAIGPDERNMDAAGWEAFGKRLAEAGKPILDAGLKFGWHNHDFEFKDLGGSDLPLDLIAAGSDDISLELDLGWTKRAGKDPIEWIDKYADRIIAVHVKDIAPEGENADEDGWADVGHGVMDWAALNKHLQSKGITHYVLEHDNPSDHERFARRSMETLKSL